MVFWFQIKTEFFRQDFLAFFPVFHSFFHSFIHSFNHTFLSLLLRSSLYTFSSFFFIRKPAGLPTRHASSISNHLTSLWTTGRGRCQRWRRRQRRRRRRRCRRAWRRVEAPAAASGGRPVAPTPRSAAKHPSSACSSSPAGSRWRPPHHWRQRGRADGIHCLIPEAERHCERGTAWMPTC